jgi:hypothetical protein
MKVLLLFLGLFVLLLWRGIVVPDPDFGWHIRLGEYILAHGIPYTDPLSYSMPSYPFVDHEWFTNVSWAVVYHLWGIVPLEIMLSALAVGSLMLLFTVSDKKWVLLPIIISGTTLFDFVGVRTQVITWFLLSILICILFQKRLWAKWRFGLPVLFLIWANLHGGFGIGLGILGVVLVGRVIEEKKRIKESLLILALCAGATLFNPFGIRLWWEFLMQLTDSQLHWTITEWFPAIYFTNIAFWGYCLLSVFLIITYRKKYTWTELCFYFLLLFAAMSSMRNIPIWIIASFFLTLRGLSYLYQEAADSPGGKRRFTLAYRIYTGILVFFFLFQGGMFCYGIYHLHEVPTQYPVKAVAYLKKHLPKQQIFSSYNWGGYLDWQLPQKKVFIDGRMPSWRWQANIKGESNYAFDEYKNVITGQMPFETFAAKYHISTLLVAKADITKPPTKFLGFSIQKNPLLRWLFFSLSSFYGVVNQAKHMGWKEVYHDNTTIIYQQQWNP